MTQTTSTYTRGGDIAGTSLRGTVSGDTYTLMFLLGGEPHFCCDKVPAQFVVTGPLGVITVYLYRPEPGWYLYVHGYRSDVPIDWHVGAKDEAAYKQFMADVFAAFHTKTPLVAKEV
jgi:hypothetical protein